MPLRLPQGNIAVSDLICRRLTFIGNEASINPRRIILPQVDEPLTPTLAWGDGDSGFYENADDEIRVSILGTGRFRWSGDNFDGLAAGSVRIRNIAATAITPTLCPNRADNDMGIGSGADDQLSLIAGGIQVANLTEAAGLVQLIVPLQNNPATPSIAFGNGDSGFYEAADDQIRVAIAGADTFLFNTTSFLGIASAGPTIINTTPSATVPTLSPNRFDLDTGIGHTTDDQFSLIAGAVQVANLTEAAGVVQLVLPSQNNAANPSLAFGAGVTGFFLSQANVIQMSSNGIATWFLSGSAIGAVLANGPSIQNEAPSATNPTLIPDRTDLDTGIGRVTTDQLALIAGGLTCMSVSEVGGARRIGFYDGSPVALQTGVAVTTAAIHAALVNLRLITA